MALHNRYIFGAFAALAAVWGGCGIAFGATIEVDGVKIKSLAIAVETAQATDDGPHIINITVDKLPAADGRVYISEPMTINGDADGNGVKCDILADVQSIQAVPMKKSQREKGYLEVQCAGRVEINDLMIHPNADASTAEAEFVDAVRLLAPKRPADHGEYILNRVWASGSDGNNGDTFVPLDTTEDLYSKPGIKKWSGQDKRMAHSIIQLDKSKPKRKALKELGSYDSTLTDCRAGLGHGPALNIAANEGTHVINGGLFGHCGNAGIRLAGENITLKGTADNRIVVLRAVHEPAANERGAISGLYDARIDLIEYVDVAPEPGTDAFSMAPSVNVKSRQNCREIADVSTVFTAPEKGVAIAKASQGTAPVKWLSPTNAWADSQARKVAMLLVFHSPTVEQAATLNKMLDSQSNARDFLGKYACSRVDVSTVSGQAIARKYQVFRVPTLLLIAPDAKSYKRVTPAATDSWDEIQTELVK